MLVDLDCFYVSVERTRDPALRGRPVIVGGLPHERGVVACASYEARRYGARAGMPLFEAARRCPRETVFLHGDHAAYTDASRSVMEILERFTPQVEPLSLDEAYLDLSGCERHHRSWFEAAQKIYETVRCETGLDVSIGIGSTRTVANVANALAKPAGVMEVRSGEEAVFLAPLPLSYLPGVGPRMREALRRFNLRTIGDLGAVPEDVMVSTFGAVGRMLSQRARGLEADLDGDPIGERSVRTHSMSRETSFARDTADRSVIDGMISYLAQRAAAALRKDGMHVRSVGVRLRYSDFKTVEARRRLFEPTDHDHEILAAAKTLWPKLYDRRVKLRLVGVVLHGLVPVKERQLSFLDVLERTAVLDEAVDDIRARHGFGAVTRGRAIGLLERLPRAHGDIAAPHVPPKRRSRIRGFRLHTPACSR